MTRLSGPSAISGQTALSKLWLGQVLSPQCLQATLQGERQRYCLTDNMHNKLRTQLPHPSPPCWLPPPGATWRCGSAGCAAPRHV